MYRIPVLKKQLPFRVATTSYIISDNICSNALVLGPLVDEIELVLFETPSQNNLPSFAEIKDLFRIAEDLDLAYNVHLPSDIFLCDPEPHQQNYYIDIILRYFERTYPLNPTLYILHLDSRHTNGLTEDNIDIWIQNISSSIEKAISYGLPPERVAIENLEFPLDKIAPVAERYGFKLCLDIGHLLLYRHPLNSQLEKYLNKCPMAHLHGVNNNIDHISISVINSQDWQCISSYLRPYQGCVALEMFSVDDFYYSMWRLKDFLPSENQAETREVDI